MKKQVQSAIVNLSHVAQDLRHEHPSQIQARINRIILGLKAAIALDEATPTPWFGVLADGNPVRPGLYQTGAVEFMEYFGKNGWEGGSRPIFWRGIVKPGS